MLLFLEKTICKQIIINAFHYFCHYFKDTLSFSKKFDTVILITVQKGEEKNCLVVVMQIFDWKTSQLLNDFDHLITDKDVHKMLFDCQFTIVNALTDYKMLSNCKLNYSM